MYVSTPIGVSICIDHVYHVCFETFTGFKTLSDLVILAMKEFDVILGMS